MAGECRGWPWSDKGNVGRISLAHSTCWNTLPTLLSGNLLAIKTSRTMTRDNLAAHHAPT